MITTTISTTPSQAGAPVYPNIDTWRLWRSRLSWGSILAGCFAALALHLVLAMLGLSLGVAVVNPQPYENDLPALSLAAGLGWSISALISLWIGGWIAGRTAPRGVGNSGGIHGVLVWCVATVVTFAFVTGGGGALVGGVMKAVGGGAARAVDVAAAQAGPALRNADFSSPGGLLASFLDEAGRDGARENLSGDAARARRETGAALTRFFTSEDASARNALVTAVASYSGRSRNDAETLVRGWEDSYKRAVDDAAAAATRAAKKAAAGAAWTCIAFCIGAFFAGWGGRCGGARYHRLRTLENDPWADYHDIPPHRAGPPPTAGIPPANPISSAM